ncbi:MAG TPA: hypothetical protein VK162_06395 [Streptosporangiaceae bacterium]|nr:hypothetical protein [Streptosporangiaceae bacterium]
MGRSGWLPRTASIPGVDLYALADLFTRPQDHWYCGRAVALIRDRR